jgi:copper(I)-binding protein
MFAKTLIASLLFAASALSAPAWADNAADIEVQNPFAREIPPGSPASASFMSLFNHSDSDIKLMSAESEVAKIVELHTHTHDNGVMRMRKIDSITIPANASAHLKPGGLHIMLIQPTQDLKAPKEISVTLNFADGSSKMVNMPIKSFMRMNKGHKMH